MFCVSHHITHLILSLTHILSVYSVLSDANRKPLLKLCLSHFSIVKATFFFIIKKMNLSDDILEINNILIKSFLIH